MNTRFSIALVLLVAFAISGCADNAMTDLRGPDAAAPAVAVMSDQDASKAACPSSLVSVSGHSTREPGQSGTYTATMKPGCTINSVSWTITGTYASSSTSGNSVTVTAGAAGTSFTVTARVVYDVDNISFGSKTVSVENPAPAPLDVTLANQGLGLRVSWNMSASEIDYFKITRSVKNLTTGVTQVTVFYSGSSYYQDNSYMLMVGGNYSLSYKVEAIDMSGVTVRMGTGTGRGDTSY